MAKQRRSLQGGARITGTSMEGWISHRESRSMTDSVTERARMESEPFITDTLISMLRIRTVIKASRRGHRLFLGRKILFVFLWKCLFLQLCPWVRSFQPWTLFISLCIYVAHIKMYHLGLWCCCLGTVCRKGGSFKSWIFHAVAANLSEAWQCCFALFSLWPILCYQKVCVCVEGAGGRLI